VAGVVIEDGNPSTIGGTSPGARNIISGNGEFGVEIVSSNGNFVLGNFIGTNVTGTAALGNGGNGVEIEEGEGNTIGGTAAGAGNLISGNHNNGVEIVASSGKGNFVQGNFIGTDVTGAAAIGNSGNGVCIGGDGNTIGGTATEARNIISGNHENGVEIVSGTGNFVQGNFIGTDVTGTAALGNGDALGLRGDGVFIQSTEGNTIGGTVAGARNLISGNHINGVEIRGSSGTGNFVQGNFIGTDVTGTATLANGQQGVYIFADGNTIGGTATEAGNIISGNGESGVEIDSGTGNFVQGNFIGTDVAGTAALANGGDGILVRGTGTIIGGTVGGARNVISGNSQNGVEIFTSRNFVQGNYIGTDARGSAPLGNALDGVFVNSGGVYDADGNTVGGTSSARNVISGNGHNGVEITGSSATGTFVQGNFIGTTADGTAALGNQKNGVLLTEGAAGNTLGGLTSTPGTGPGNVISGNQQNGIALDMTAGDDNRIQGNIIGLDAAGLNALKNLSAGVLVNWGRDTHIGDANPLARNVISGNRYGINLSTSGSNLGTLIQGNFIGTDLTGTLARSNSDYGVAVGNSPGTTITGNVIAGSTIAGVAIYHTYGSSVLQGNFIGTTAAGTRALPNVTGVLVYGGSTGIQLGGTTAAARNLISGNYTDGVRIQGSDTTGIMVQGNYIGTNVSGGQALGNGATGVFVSGAAGNTIGGTAAGAGNLISANDEGIVIAGTTATGNSIQGNWIGTNAAGAAALGNRVEGVSFLSGPGNTLGGTVAGAGNVISGNGSYGVVLYTPGTTVQGNYIGTDSTGSAALGNRLDGVLVSGATDNTIGGPAGGAGNVISGNGAHGIEIANLSLVGQVLLSTNNRVQGNLIGTDATGSHALGNSLDGVLVNGAPGNTIGGIASGSRNVISGNDHNGVEISGSSATGTFIQGNFIGTDLTGTLDLGNSLDGALINGAPGATVGGIGAGNVISGNDQNGVEISGSAATGTLVQGNFIGTDGTGRVVVGNSRDGVVVNGAALNTIGGTASGMRNLISGNGGNGIQILGDSTHIVVQGNYIGPDLTGSASLGNAAEGVLVNGCHTNPIGGTAAGAGNLISGNGLDGIVILGAGGNLVQGNYIGTKAGGMAALGNGRDSILLDFTYDNHIGGTAAGAGNLISGNQGTGIRMVEFHIGGNLVEGNHIGTDVSGLSPLGNSRDGVRLDGVSGNRIGDITAGAANTIAFNGGAGVFVASGTRNSIRGNSIFFNTGLGIDLAPVGVTPNDLGDFDTGANNLQNFPALAGATTNGVNSVTIRGTLNSTASTVFTLDFYASAVADPTHFGEGAIYLGSTTVMTPANALRSVAFGVTLTVAVPASYVIAATATDPAGNTSEFCKMVTAKFRATSTAATTPVAPQAIAPATDLLPVAPMDNAVPLSSTLSAGQLLGEAVTAPGSSGLTGQGVPGAGSAPAPSTGRAATSVLDEAFARYGAGRRTPDLAWSLDRDWAAGVVGLRDFSLLLESHAKN
jgi:hypothetical protein